MRISRKLFHVIAGTSLPVIGLLLGEEFILIFFSILSVVAISIELARFIRPPLNKFLIEQFRFMLKDPETHRITGATYMIISALLCFLLFNEVIAVASLLFLSIGDPTASMIGSRFSKPRWLNKSPFGSLGFFLVSAIIAAIIEACSSSVELWILIAGAAIAAVVELLPIPIDDNLTVPLISGVAMTLIIYVL